MSLIDTNAATRQNPFRMNIASLIAIAADFLSKALKRDNKTHPHRGESAAKLARAQQDVDRFWRHGRTF